MKKIIPFSKELSFKTRIAEITDIEISHNLERTPFHTIDGSFLVDGTYKMHEASQIEEKFSYELPFTIEVDDRYDLSDVKIKISDFFFEIINEDTLKVNIEVELSEVKEKKQEEEMVLETAVERKEEAPGEGQKGEILSKDILDVAEKNQEVVLERCYDEEQDEKEKLEEKIEEKQPEQKIEIIEPIDILDSEIPFALEKKDSKKMSVKKTPTDAKIIPSETENIEVEKPISKPITDIFTSINNNEDAFKAYYVYIVRENDTLDSILSRYQITKEEASEYNDLNDLKIGSKLILPCTKNE